MGHVLFQYCNESLEAINIGLTVEPDDSVLSICGCGAQPLSFLEYISEGNVTAIDNNPTAIRLAQTALRHITQKNYSTLRHMALAPRDGYYFDPERAARIAKNQAKIHFVQLDVRNQPTLKGPFSKAYFSNARVRLDLYAPLFSEGALIYLTIPPITHLPDEDMMGFLSRIYKANPADFDLIHDRSEISRTIEKETLLAFRKGRKLRMYWRPAILRKLTAH
ncbi:hypothetical protein ACFL0V_04575 [Nanoarchaeota archaeon]